jgi:hypothetical protein
MRRSFFHQRFADNTGSDSVATRMRRQRCQLFLDMLDGRPRTSILDSGGRPKYWQIMMDGCDLGDRLQVTLLNLETQAEPHPDFRVVVGDARAMPQFADGEFDIVFSNSTIEHVGDFADQQRMANEVRRVGRRYYVQTPNRYFPVEPHFVFPLFQFLPIATRVWLMRHFQLGWMPKLPDRGQARREVESIRLLSRAKMQQLFPGAAIYDEKLAGLVKSFVAYTATSY